VTSPDVVVLDYGSGNLRSAERSLARAGASVTVTADAGAALECSGLVVPGVGAFAACMAGLRSVGGEKIIARRVELGDALDEGVAFHLDSPGSAHGSSVRAVKQDARVIGVVGPGTERAEVREDVPDFLRARRNGAGALNVGHLLKLRVG